MTTLFQKKYDGESLYDLQRDIQESLEEDFNPAVGAIPKDKYGIQLGTFKVTIEWTGEEQQT